MNELDNDAWPHDKAPPDADGPALDDQAALAFEIAAMRVRASWDDLDAPTDIASSDPPPMDPFAPIVPASVADQAPVPAPAPEPEGALRRSPPPADLVDQGVPAAALTDGGVQPADQALLAGGTARFDSPSSAVETAPMAFLIATPVARGSAYDPARAPHFEEPTPAPTFLPGNRPSGKTIAVAVMGLVLVGAVWLLSGDDASKEAAQEPTPSAPAPRNERVERPVPRVPSPGAIALAPSRAEPDGRLAAAKPGAPRAAAPASSVSAQAERPWAAAAVAPVAPPPARETVAAADRQEAKAMESARRSKRSAQARAQRHESAPPARAPVRASAEPRAATKRKLAAEVTRPAAREPEAPKRKGTGFVSANPY